MLKNSLLLIVILTCLSGFAQELNCRVIVNAERIQISDRSIFDEMETVFAEFMNDTKWTDDEFKTEERINCNIVINLDPENAFSDPTIGNFAASVQVVSSRPVYGSSYETIVFNFADRDWAFSYNASQPLQFNLNSYVNEITSLLSFYAYTIIGMDYDTFSELGGDPYFTKSLQIVTTAQQSNRAGWTQNNSNRNRYWLTENLLNAQMQPLRKATYEYHIKGLDLFYENPEEGRQNVFNSLKKVLNTNQARPRSILTITFMDSKSTEIAKIFSEGDLNIRKNAFNMLVNIDPTKRSTFEEMIKN
ncbi:MAG: DUF4835 family protein [Cyclobacteriaceae bacterium]